MQEQLEHRWRACWQCLTRIVSRKNQANKRHAKISTVNKWKQEQRGEPERQLWKWTQSAQTREEGLSLVDGLFHDLHAAWATCPWCCWCWCCGGSVQTWASICGSLASAFTDLIGTYRAFRRVWSSAINQNSNTQCLNSLMIRLWTMAGMPPQAQNVHE